MNTERAAQWAEYWKVDEAIEAIEYSKAGITTERWREIERELMTLAPKAYMDEGVTLATIWNKLEERTRNELYTAFLADYWPREPR